MTAEAPVHSPNLQERYDSLCSRVSLIRDICAVIATETQFKAYVESLSREGWDGLFLLSEDVVEDMLALRGKLFVQIRT